MTAPKPRHSPEDIILARRIFFVMVGTLVFLLGCLLYGALK